MNVIAVFSYLGLGLMSGRFQVVGGQQTSDGTYVDRALWIVQFFIVVRICSVVINDCSLMLKGTSKGEDSPVLDMSVGAEAGLDL